MNARLRALWFRLRVFLRFVALRRQLAEVTDAIDALSLSDRRLLVAHLAREMDISERESRDAQTTNASFARVRSDNARLRVLGLAQWLASAFRETEDNPHAEMREMHRHVMRTMRLLRENAPAAA